MTRKDPRVDAYIAKSAAFAAPILKRIRAAVHKGHPLATETIKWGVPAYVDDRGIVCMTAAFTRHCAWVFWTGRKPSSVDAKSLRRITAASELPDQHAMVTLVKEAVSSSRELKKKSAAKRPARPVRVPAYFAAALSRNSKAHAAFKAFAPSHRREYVEWVDSAKTDETRERRLATAIQWISSGKSRNWKYER
jgi:uncharacterized protein YdeI (YjbR/CyaY-like superfamily)